MKTFTLPKVMLIVTLLISMNSLNGQTISRSAAAELGLTVQAISHNPAYEPESRITIAIPILNISTIMHSPMSFADVYGNTTTNNTQHTPQATGKMFSTGNHLTTATDVTLLGFTYKTKFGSFNFMSHIRTKGLMSLDKELATIIANPHINDIDYKNNHAEQINGLAFHEFALGYQNSQLVENLSLGVRIKLLFGIAHIKDGRSMVDLKLDTSTKEGYLKNDWEVIVCNPFSSIISQNTNLNAIDAIPFEFYKSAFKFNNLGIAADFGAIYTLDRFKFSLAINDLGFIHWNKDLFRYVSQTEEKIELDDLPQSEKEVEQFKNELINRLKLQQVEAQPYNTSLYSHIVADVDYTVLKWLTVGAGVGLQFDPLGAHSRVSLLATARPNDHFGASVSYSVYNNDFRNIGLTLTAGKRIRGFIALDNLLIHGFTNGKFMPFKRRTYSGMLGLSVNL